MNASQEAERQNVQPLLELSHVTTVLSTSRGRLTALDDLSLTIRRGEVVAIVGESGSGKSMLAKTILGVLPSGAQVAPGGSMKFDGVEMLGMSEKARNEFRGSAISMVFQDAMTALNPVVRVRRQIGEVLKFHTNLRGAEARKRIVELLTEVGISDPEARLKAYPLALSGGMRQRIAIAAAVACVPKLLIADEPTTALDVTVQQQVLQLLDRLRAKHRMSVMLITHNLALVAGRADRTAVMYAGRIVEQGPTTEVFRKTRHPYTELLLNCIPRIDAPRNHKLAAIPGQPPDLRVKLGHCAFASRCPRVQPLCRQSEPPLRAIDGTSADHLTRCFFPIEPTEGASARASIGGRRSAGMRVGGADREGLQA